MQLVWSERQISLIFSEPLNFSSFPKSIMRACRIINLMKLEDGMKRMGTYVVQALLNCSYITYIASSYARKHNMPIPNLAREAAHH